MAPDFRFVPDAAQADLDKLPADCLSDRFYNAGLTHAGRTHKAKDRPLHILFQLKDRQVFDNPFLDIFQSVMIPVQDFPCPVQIQIVFCFLSPGQIQDPLNIRLADRAFRASRRHA